MHPLFRFTLDLFDSNQPVAQVEKALKAINNIAKAKRPEMPPTASTTLHAEADATLLGQASFRHPRASRELRLGAVLVAYEFKRGQRRSIGFSVGPDGLAVRAPKWVPLYEVDAALQAKSPWILRKLQETRERHARLAEHVIEWRDGACMPFLGHTVTLKLDPHHRFGAAGAELVEIAVQTASSATAGDGGASAVPSLERVLAISLAHSASAEQIRDVVQAWLMRQARRVFQERLDHFAPLLGVQWKKLSLSNAGTRWGSARIDGSIRLNWRLVHCKMSVLDYVVAHELSHLHVMDHSPRFWDTVASVVPDYAAQRRQLKDEAPPRWER